MELVPTMTGDVAQPSAPSQVDKWLFWPAGATTAPTAVVVFVSGLPGAVGFFLFLLSLLVYPLAAISLLVFAVALAWKRQFRKAVSIMFAFVAPIILWIPFLWMADYLHLALTVEFGMGYIGPAPSPDLPFQTYDWSTGLVTNPATFLIRDETDDIALPIDMHKHPEVLEYGFGEECAGRVQHLLGHYYVCTFTS